jgi:hypothetical protein
MSTKRKRLPSDPSSSIAKSPKLDSPPEKPIFITLDIAATVAQVYDALCKKNSLEFWLTKLLSVKGRQLTLSFGENGRFWAEFGTHLSKTPSKASVSWYCKRSTMYVEEASQTSPWTGTKVIFSLTLIGKDKQSPITRLEFTHQGMLPSMLGYHSTLGFWNAVLYRHLARYVLLTKSGHWIPDKIPDWNTVVVAFNKPICLDYFVYFLTHFTKKLAEAFRKSQFLPNKLSRVETHWICLT